MNVLLFHSNDNVNNPFFNEEDLDQQVITKVNSTAETIELLKANKYDVLLFSSFPYFQFGVDVINFLESNQEYMPANIGLIVTNEIADPLLLNRLQQFFKEGKILSYKATYEFSAGR